MSKEVEVVVGDGENPEVTQMGLEVNARGGIVESYWRYVIPQIHRLNPDDTLIVMGGTTVVCVPELINYARKELKVKHIIVDLRKCRRGRNDLGDNNNLPQRLATIERWTGGDIFAYPEITVIP